MGTAALLLGLAVIVVVCQLMAWLARRLGQPPVIGEIIGGILLGPSLFGGHLTSALFPTDIRPMLSAFANIGVALFMFVMGMELDRAIVGKRIGRLGWLCTGSLAAPVGFGIVLANWLLHDHPSKHPAEFVALMATAMAVTAFPVLARVISDRGLLGTHIGGLALAVSAVGDVIAWSVLAVVVALTSSTSPWRLLLLAPYGLIMVFVVPRMLRTRLMARLDRRSALLVVVVGVVLSSAATEWMGLHLIFGAFLFGLVVPRDAGLGKLRRELGSSIQPLAQFLIPIYFAVAGLNVNLSHLDGAAGLQLVFILLVAIGGKLLGVYAAARGAGLDHRSSAGLASLMNIRGLTELVLLTVGFQIGLLDGTLYSLMVVMAVVTTVMAGPLLRLSLGTAPATRPDVSPVQYQESR